MNEEEPYFIEYECEFYRGTVGPFESQREANAWAERACRVGEWEAARVDSPSATAALIASRVTEAQR